ncbi:VRR-NUC domain-containing protein [Methylobacterium nodulans]|uniref:VRR-NUC domain protein n=1 Tax=Methylobacterium nodulans (strain LMG 21967 / CNCM I-2342 / ORS 2060) TaxID=460265 RepID=B8IA58_METNO|nr:VRR-NUC domain-containing protein [Methylobacterium nodulans]ACL59121.1 VRR-NUC domain protein [Methylobacterium nodulans ORS 2060]
MTRARPEHHIQAAIVARLRGSFDAIVAAVPNGGRRGKREAVELRAEGVEPGHPDLIAYGRDGRVLLLEVKAAGGSLSAAQRRLIPNLRERGFPVAVVRDIEGAVQAMREAGFGPRRGPAPEPATEF